MEIKGTITEIKETIKGETAAGKSWEKLTFVIDTETEYDNIIAFDVFGEEAVERFNKYNKVGDKVKVIFNIKCREYQGKYYTNLAAWRIEDATEKVEEVEVVDNDGLPF